jgi:hypothetical protein
MVKRSLRRSSLKIRSAPYRPSPLASFFSFAFFALMLVPFARAQDYEGACDIRLLITSTLHDITGRVRCRPFPVTVVDDGNGKRGIPRVDVIIPVDEIDTGNKTRDRQMREMFWSDRFPWIRGVFEDIDPDAFRERILSSPEGRATLDMILRVRNIGRPAQAVVSNFREEDGSVVFDAEFPVSLKAYALEPPTVLFFIRVGDTVTVNTTARLEKVPPR